MKSKIVVTLVSLFIALFSICVAAQQMETNNVFTDLKNYQVNTPQMMSSGLPTRKHFEAFKSNGVSNVVDLIPGDRSEETTLMTELNLQYHNIAVEWENPTVENFEEYVNVMRKFEANDGITLTHCRLNWRGAVFTYLYRVTQLNTPEEAAKQDLLAIWQPNEIWLNFIDKVKAKYSLKAQ